MNPPDLQFWGSTFGWLALGVGLVFLFVSTAAAIARSAATRRDAWRAGLCAVALLLGMEVMGWDSVIHNWMPEPVVAEKASPIVPPNVSPAEALVEQGNTPVSEPELRVEPMAPVAVVAQAAAISVDEAPLISDPSAGSTIPMPTFAAAEVSEPVWWPMMVWCFGVALCLTRLAWNRLVMLRIVRRSTVELCGEGRELLNRLCERFPSGRKVRLIHLTGLRAPVAFGSFSPTICVPADFEDRFTEQQREVMLAHELAHLNAWDPFWLGVSNLVVSLLWWHPLAWVAARKLRAVSEEAADDASLLFADGPGTLAECLAVIGREYSPNPRGVIGMALLRSTLGQRVERLLRKDAQPWTPPRSRRAAIVVAGAALLICGATLMLSTISRGSERTSIAHMFRAVENQAESPDERQITKLAQAPPPSVKGEEVVETIISGNVKLLGTLPDELRIVPDSSLLKMRDGRPIWTRFYRRSTNGGLADVVIYLEAPFAGQSFPMPAGAQEILAEKGEFEPYVSAVRVGQEVIYRLGESGMVGVMCQPKYGPEWLRSLMPGHRSFSRRFEIPELFVKHKTDLYPWMYTYVSVFDHPYFAVTDTNGNFSFPTPLPAGNYTIVAHHRKAGEITRKIVVDANSEDVTAIAFELKSPVSGPQRVSSTAPALRTRRVEEEPKRYPIARVEGRKELLNHLKLLKIPAFETGPLSMEKVLEKLDEVFLAVDSESRRVLLFLNPGKPAPAGERRELKSVQVRVSPGRNRTGMELLSAVVAGASVPIQFNVSDGGVTFSFARPARTSSSRVVKRPLGSRDFHPFSPLIPVTPNLGEQRKALVAEIVQSQKIFLKKHPKMVSLKDRLQRLDQAIQEAGGLDSERLISMHFKVDRERFRGDLETLMGEGSKAGADSAGVRVTGFVASKGKDDAEKNRRYAAMIRQLMKESGFEFERPGQENVEVQLIYNHANGILLARASSENLTVVESVIRMLNVTVDQVLVESHWAEFPLPKGAARAALTAALTKVAPQLDLDKLLGVLPGQFRNSASAARSDAGTNVAEQAANKVIGVLSPEQFDKVRHIFSMADGVDFLTAPRLITISGRQAQISVVDLHTVLTPAKPGEPVSKDAPEGFTPSMIRTGPSLDVLPQVTVARDEIRVTYTATINEFLGYDETPPAVSTRSGKRSAVPRPRIRERKIAGSRVIPDGHTVVMGGIQSTSSIEKRTKVPVIGDIPFLGRIFRSKKTEQQRNQMIIFVTPTITDPAGNPSGANAKR